jgi:hypothetical protein
MVDDQIIRHYRERGWVPVDQGLDLWCSDGRSGLRNIRREKIMDALEDIRLKQKPIVSLYTELSAEETELRSITRGHGDSLEIKWTWFENFLAEQRENEPQEESATALDPRERKTLLCIVATLKDTLLELERAKPEPSGRDFRILSQAKLIERLLEKYSNVPGISEKTLQAKFSEANRTLSAEK